MIKSLLKLATIGISSLFPSMAYSQVRNTFIEDFSTSISRPYVSIPSEKWNIINGQFECDDINKQSGFFNFYYDDIKYFPDQDFIIKASVTKDKWGSDWDIIGINFSVDNNSNYYYFGINAPYRKYWIMRNFPGESSLLMHNVSDPSIFPDKPNILEVRINSTGTTFLINGIKPKCNIYCNSETTIDFNGITDSPTGKIGLFGYLFSGKECKLKKELSEKNGQNGIIGVSANILQ